MRVKIQITKSPILISTKRIKKILLVISFIYRIKDYKAGRDC